MGTPITLVHKFFIHLFPEKLVLIFPQCCFYSRIKIIDELSSYRVLLLLDNTFWSIRKIHMHLRVWASSFALSPLIWYFTVGKKNNTLLEIYSNCCFVLFCFFPSSLQFSHRTQCIYRVAHGLEHAGKITFALSTWLQESILYKFIIVSLG